MNSSEKKNLGMAVSAAVLACILAAFAVGKMKSLFGIYIPQDMVVGITSPLSFGLFFLAVWLHYQRRNPDTQKITRGLLTFLAFALLVIGWRFTALDYVFTPNMANNGYTVTGGFMMLASGLIFGALLATRETPLIQSRKAARAGKDK